jgi:hypothetical protein
MKFNELIYNEMKIVDLLTVNLSYLELTKKFNVVGPLRNFSSLNIGEIKKFKFTEKEINSFKKKFNVKILLNDDINNMKNLKDFLIKKNVVLSCLENKTCYFINSNILFEVKIEKWPNSNKDQISFYCSTSKISNKTFFLEVLESTTEHTRPKVDSNITMSNIMEIGINHLAKKLKLKTILFSGIKEQFNKKSDQDKTGKSSRDRLYLYVLKKKFGNLNKVEQLKNKEGVYFKINLK